jgi:hypothetical protein
MDVGAVGLNSDMSDGGILCSEIFPSFVLTVIE